MTDRAPRIRPNRHIITASSALEAVAAGLNAIKNDGHYSDAVLADPLFKSPDRVRDYRLAHSEMGVATFLRGVAAWGEAFAGPALGLAGYRLARLEDDGKIEALPISGLLHKVIAANADGHISDRELLDMGDEITSAGAVLDTLRDRRASLKAGAR